jgi:phenylpyruvate tautomerase PptA (4-oxalocrotonate tautomerase family)
MPHLTLHALEDDLAGREAAIATALTAAVVDVYGPWARGLVNVQMVGLPRGRWAVGGRLVATLSPSVTFGIREAAFARPDADELVRKLITSVTNAVASVFGEERRPGITVELVATPPGRTGVGGVVE